MNVLFYRGKVIMINEKTPYLLGKLEIGNNALGKGFTS